ncbi:MAG: transposase [Acidimicrobiia bacterium]|nr:transposase [Acidimicrobiia bacterium]
MVETVNRVRRAGATGPITIRADKGFWSHKTVRKLEDMGVEWFIAIPMYSNVKQAIGHLDDTDWVDIGYTPDGVAQVAETTIVTKIDKTEHTVRLIIRRTRLADPEQQPLWKDWRHHTFATNNRHLSATEADQMYRNHARVELGIRDLKHHTGLAHCPSGRFFANAAWMAAAVIAHNLYRWINHHTGAPSERLTNGNTVRTRLFKLPGRIVNHAGQLIVRLPTNWPWASAYRTALQNIRALPQLC